MFDFFFTTYEVLVSLIALPRSPPLGCLAAALLGDAAALRVEQPNALNVAYSHQLTLALLALLYPYGSYVMVGHMWRARVKQLGGGADARAKAA